MADFVLIHGAWGGAWVWDDVAAILQTAGHSVVAPSLTGLGTRAGELTPEVGLQTHIDDVGQAIEDSNGPVILVGHSYGGMLLSGASVTHAAAVRHVVNVDGFMPHAGETNRELLPDAAIAHFERSLHDYSPGWRLPPRRLSTFGVDQTRGHQDKRLSDHPRRTYTDVVEAGVEAIAVPGTYLLCTGWDTPFGRFADRAASLGWEIRSLASNHMVPITHPDLLASELLRIAAEPA